MLDCLSRLLGVAVHPLPGESALPVATGYAAQRRKEAIRTFDAALQIDPGLLEARMRRARLQAAGDSGAARELERIAEASTMPFAYLAAVSRGSLAHTEGDASTAVRWYERALALHPRSTAASIALVALKPGTSFRFDELDSDDVYYRYPCTVLTTDVAIALADRVKRVVTK